jgi:hypothetical protein
VEWRRLVSHLVFSESHFHWSYDKVFRLFIVHDRYAMVPFFTAHLSNLFWWVSIDFDQKKINITDTCLVTQAKSLVWITKISMILWLDNKYLRKSQQSNSLFTLKVISVLNVVNSQWIFTRPNSHANWSHSKNELIADYDAQVKQRMQAFRGNLARTGLNYQERMS